MPARESAQRVKSAGAESPSELIDARIKELPDWRGEVLSRMRRLIQQADPEVVEEVKWRKPSNPAGVPVWSHGFETHVFSFTVLLPFIPEDSAASVNAFGFFTGPL